MKRKIKLMPKSHYIYFTDIFDEDELFCLTPEVHKENELIFNFTLTPYDVTDEKTIKAFKLEKVGEDTNYDLYDIISETPIDFQINKIKWIIVYYDPHSMI